MVLVAAPARRGVRSAAEQVREAILVRERGRGVGCERKKRVDGGCYIEE